MRVSIRKVFTEIDSFGHLSILVGCKDHTGPALRLVPCGLCFSHASNDRCCFLRGAMIGYGGANLHVLNTLIQAASVVLFFDSYAGSRASGGGRARERSQGSPLNGAQRRKSPDNRVSGLCSAGRTYSRLPGESI